MQNLARLHDPFPPERVSWRVGSTTADKTKGMALAYIDARDVMHRLDEVCGPENWQCRYSHADRITVCEIGIRVNDEWVWKANGAGDTDFEGEKGALSDAFKRAAVVWGIGRYLYELDSPWVTIEPAGKSFKIVKSVHNQTALNNALGVMSANRAKQEMDWSAIMNELEGDLVDVKSKADLRLLWKAWDERRQKEGWPLSFWGQAKERMTEFSETLPQPNILMAGE